MTELPLITSIRFRDLRVTDPVMRMRLMSAVERVLESGTLIMGPEVETFEATFAKFCQVPYAVGVASGTSALYLAMRSLGIGPGDEVITTPMSWIATLNCIKATGATPVFVDIGTDLNINPLVIESKIGPKTKAILAVHYTGRMCDMTAICRIASTHGLLVVEDAAQAAGAEIDGKPAGSFGDASGFSFNPMKVFGGYGEGGMVTTKTIENLEKLKSLRYLGTIDKEICIDPELNHKIDSIQAAMLMETLPFLSDWIDKRIVLAQRYLKNLNSLVTCPLIEPGRRSTFFDYTILAKERDNLAKWLEKNGIECKVKHRILMCNQPAYERFAEVDVPHARSLVKQILTLPLHEKMTESDVDYVSNSIQRYYEQV
jgi:dTDP-4-amino-4,6-dideoxygalactose transaminase